MSFPWGICSPPEPCWGGLSRFHTTWPHSWSCLIGPGVDPWHKHSHPPASCIISLARKDELGRSGYPPENWDPGSWEIIVIPLWAAKLEGYAVREGVAIWGQDQDGEAKKGSILGKTVYWNRYRERSRGPSKKDWGERKTIPAYPKTWVVVFWDLRSLQPFNKGWGKLRESLFLETLRCRARNSLF